MEPEGFTSKCCEVYNILYGHHSLGPCVMKLGNIALSLCSGCSWLSEYALNNRVCLITREYRMLQEK